MLERIMQGSFFKCYWAATVVKGCLKMCPLDRGEKLREQSNFRNEQKSKHSAAVAQFCGAPVLEGLTIMDLPCKLSAVFTKKSTLLSCRKQSLQTKAKLKLFLKR